MKHKIDLENQHEQYSLNSTSQEIETEMPKRSLAQNRYLHLILGYFACEYGSSLRDVKLEFFKHECNQGIFYRERIGKGGEPETYLRSTAELTPAEMTLAIERFRNYASIEAGIYLPSPDEEERIQYIKQEIKRNKEFI